MIIGAAGLSLEVKILAEDTLARYIFPLPSPSTKEDIDEDEWTRRFFRTLANADEVHFNAVLGMSGLNAVSAFYSHLIPFTDNILDAPVVPQISSSAASSIM
jgi:hypothetical protein